MDPTPATEARPSSLRPETLAEYWDSYQRQAMPGINKEGMAYRLARKTFLFGATAVLSKIEDALRLLPDEPTPEQKGRAVQDALADAQNELTGLLRPQPRAPRLIVPALGGIPRA